ncbi:MAG: hypothetical protein COZ08_09050 [Bacteroidetes bacterium CG_4_10_14_3_um_filter_42_6]|nr:MAG: hypothetical protein COZ08_09050 [Bacteroidetes bacterium CG_4_10_14_3_um_filter_42_6]PJB59114.1 MAG: hypothetical protein CO098_05175 [Bacteroidetes bacterium CG_4_9_14_3_um_filter_41_19]
MKTKLLLLNVLLLFGAFESIAQPQWKFHVAFEDATSAKDTIWFIWDTTATLYGIDTTLGEGNPHMDYNKFNVWTLTWAAYPNDYDTTKVVAHPFDDSFGSTIEAINFELPITITWDSAMLHADWLPPSPVGWINYARIDNDYFFFYNNNGLAHQYDMTLSDLVIAPNEGNNDPWAWQDWVHFPMDIFLIQDPTLGVENNSFETKNIIVTFPNPFIKNTSIEFYLENKSYVELSVFDLQGKKIRSLINQTLNSGNHTLKWNGLDQAGKPCKPGPYFIYLNINGTSIQSINLIKY